MHMMRDDVLGITLVERRGKHMMRDDVPEACWSTRRTPGRRDVSLQAIPSSRDGWSPSIALRPRHWALAPCEVASRPDR
jgi:hypothetical protein